MVTTVETSSFMECGPREGGCVHPAPRGRKGDGIRGPCDGERALNSAPQDAGCSLDAAVNFLWANDLPFRFLCFFICCVVSYTNVIQRR